MSVESVIRKLDFMDTGDVWETAVHREIERINNKEMDEQNPILQNFQYRHWLSRSKGQGEKRKTPLEIEYIKSRSDGTIFHIKNDQIIDELDRRVMDTIGYLVPHGESPTLWLIDYFRSRRK